MFPRHRATVAARAQIEGLADRRALNPIRGGPQTAWANQRIERPAPHGEPRDMPRLAAHRAVAGSEIRRDGDAGAEDHYQPPSEAKAISIMASAQHGQWPELVAHFSDQLEAEAAPARTTTSVQAMNVERMILTVNSYGCRDNTEPRLTTERLDTSTA
jgi:hypothetical protein